MPFASRYDAQVLKVATADSTRMTCYTADQASPQFCVINTNKGVGTASADLKEFQKLRIEARTAY